MCTAWNQDRVGSPPTATHSSSSNSSGAQYVDKKACLHLEGEPASKVGQETPLGVGGPGSIQMPYNHRNCHNRNCRATRASVSTIPLL